ncbi:hypothetical protein CTAYLR_010427 [Chrysophaeum taylorii]|uniref:Sulfotransferase n=1 Tax=Chrysophaeum taylorii TaxID=2483200 RepID=A0AAD7U951_9STRA|nr:hypothetical protein CTAYLR_010427 [Chrysophaeum taylorii]
MDRKDKYDHPGMWCQAHRMSLPEPNTDTILCVPQKNGNVDWNLLMYQLWTGVLPKSAVEAKHFRGRYTYGSTNVSSTSHVLFIARHPYSRLLSYYLDKVVASHYSDRFPALRKKAKFSEFVQYLHGRWVAEKLSSICILDHHLCAQVEGCYFPDAAETIILKHEDERSWIHCELKYRLNADDAKLFDPDWRRRGFRNGPCFYEPDCHSNTTGGIITGSFHPTHASSPEVLEAHYDRNTARLVNDLYAADFAILGYAKWDGQEPFFVANITLHSSSSSSSSSSSESRS